MCGKELRKLSGKAIDPSQIVGARLEKKKAANMAAFHFRFWIVSDDRSSA